MSKRIPLVPYLIDGKKETDERFQERVAQYEAQRRVRRPLLSTFVMRLPMQTHQALREASARQGITMSEIVLMGLQQTLPELLTAPPLSRKKGSPKG